MTKLTGINRKYLYMVTVFLIGIAGSIVVHINEKKEAHIKEGNRIYRNEWDADEYNLNLNYYYEDDKELITIPVKTRDLSKEEITKMLGKCADEVDKVVLQNNLALDEVKSNLYFPTKIRGFPFKIHWNIEEDDLIDSTGKLLCDKSCQLEHFLHVRAIYTYNDFRYENNYEFRIVHPTLDIEEKSLLEIEENIKRAFADSSAKEIVLPNEVNGKAIKYKETGIDKSIMVLLITIIITVLVGIASEYDGSRKELKKQEMLNLLYADFVEKLKLYMISGLTVKNSMLNIMSNIQKTKDNEELRKYIADACHKYKNGVSESKIIYEFGNNCKGPYKKLAMLLNVNMKQGNSRIIELLDSEIDKALIQRKELAKKKGDEAAVKLLFPMMLMLLIIMLLIIVPVYSEIY